jgi:hypothetical protein
MVGKHESYNVFLFMISVVDPNSFFRIRIHNIFFFWIRIRNLYGTS